MLVETDFDGLLENDVIFEETDQTLDYKEILKNSENIIKSFLYLKRVTDGTNPYVNSVLKMDTVDFAEKTAYTPHVNTGLILVKNVSALVNGSIFFNGGEFVLFPFESLEFPILSTSVLELSGNFSILESEYKLGKS